MNFSRSFTTSLAAADIWAFIIDPANLKEWIPQVVEVGVKSQDFESPGRKADLLLRAVGFNVAASLTYIKVSEDKNLRLNIDSDYAFVQVDISLSSSIPSETKVNFSVDVELQGMAKFAPTPSQSNVDRVVEEYQRAFMKALTSRA